MATATIVQESHVASHGEEAPICTTVNYWKSDLNSMPAIDKSMPFVDRKMAFIKYQMGHFDPHTVAVHDIRGHEDDFTLGKQGFQLFERQIKTKSFDNDDQIKGSYYQEVEQLLKDITGCHRVYIYDHHMRNLSYEDSLVAPPDEESLDIPGPVRYAHVDDTAESARRIIGSAFPSEADGLISAPFCIINVWRPLKPVFKDPLGLVDARSVKPEQRVEAFLPAPDGDDFGIYQIRAGAEHKWHFVRNQQPDEFLLFKIYDSQAEGSFFGVPHTSFVDPETEHLEENRESIEVRCLCFFEHTKV